MVRVFESDTSSRVYPSHFLCIDTRTSIYLSLSFMEVGKSMMNDRQEIELSLSAEQPVFGKRVDRRWRRGQRYFVIGTSLLIIASLLVLAFLVPDWDTQLAPQAHQPVLATHENPYRQQTPTPPVIPTPQTALIASQVDSLLTNKVAHQQFSGSVLIAHHGQVLLSKGYS